MQTDREHRLRDNLGRTFLYTRWPQFEEDRQLRKEAVVRYKVFAQQHFQVIAESGTDPFHYGLLDLWLDLYREPWAKPRTLAKLVDDLAEKIASGELRVYLEDSLMWRHVSSGNSNGGGGAPTPRVDQYDEVRSREATYSPHPDDRYTLQNNVKPTGTDEEHMPTRLDVTKGTPFGKLAPATNKQLQKKFKHAGDFGVEGNFSKANGDKFNTAIQKHLNASGTKEIQGVYRGNTVIFHTDPKSGLTVIQNQNGSFLSGWKLNPQQLKHVLKDGKL